MTQTYKQIQKQIEALQRQAEKLREQEVAGVVDRIKDAISHYGLTAKQLGFGTTAGATKAKTGQSGDTRSGKYSDGQGNAWSGRGPRPRWLREELSAGRSLEEFTAQAPAAKSNSPAAKGSKKRQSKFVYRDQAGHSWTGMGPRPRWLKEALAAGRSLEELAA